MLRRTILRAVLLTAAGVILMRAQTPQPQVAYNQPNLFGQSDLFSNASPAWASCPVKFAI